MIDLVSVAYAAEEASQTGGGVAQIGLDWQLFLAQLINFGIIFFVMYKWVLKPISNALKQRQKIVADSLENAKVLEDKLANIKSEHARTIDEAKKEASVLLAEAEKQANANAQAMKKRAQEDIAKTLMAAKVTLQEEQVRMIKEVRTAAADLIVTATERIIDEKMTPQREQRFVEQVARK